jgi:hypothetical protein
MQDMEGIQRDAVKLKFIDAPLSKERLSELIQIPPRKKWPIKLCNINNL